MKLGALLGITMDASDPRALADQARRLEDEGFDSLWAAQAVGRGFMLMDPFLSLAVAATVTQSVSLGTAVIQLPLYPVAELAHRVFCLQQLCGERLKLGVGAGSTESDFLVCGRDYRSRHADFTTGVEQLRGLLQTGGLDGVKLDPWPAVSGGPPLLFGSWGRGVGRAAREFDGWIASLTYRSLDEVVAAHGRYREAGGQWAVASTIPVGAETDPGELGSLLDSLEEVGFDEAVVAMRPGAPPSAEIRKLVG